GKGQGMWNSYMTDPTLNITTPYHQIKAGTYTGEIAWNLVAGPSV
ncbi:WxL domain-containing protein, partial [Enterococcus faecalis]